MRPAPLVPFVDLKRILRTMRHAQMEQRENPKTGERMVPPSVKFAVWVALILVGGALLWVGAAQFSDAGGDAGGALGTGDDGVGDNNTTGDESTPAPEAASEDSAAPPILMVAAAADP